MRVPYDVEGWGVGEIWFDGPRLVWHELPRAPIGADEPPTKTLAGKSSPVGDRSVSASLRRRLERYFAGETVSFADVELELENWTPFQLDVATALRGVPYGEVLTYSDLARLAGYPRAQRAVGSFCARNRYPLVLPCHRVVGASGLGPYGSLGQEYKRRLLALEHVAL